MRQTEYCSILQGGLSSCRGGGEDENQDLNGKLTKNGFPDLNEE